MRKTNLAILALSALSLISSVDSARVRFTCLPSPQNYCLTSQQAVSYAEDCRNYHNRCYTEAVVGLTGLVISGVVYRGMKRVRNLEVEEAEAKEAEKQARERI
ncbi:MAG: hypothetical protein WC796_05950 [Candidatus Pacearchaeota archaeon]|jgi:hypothetical protein